MVSSVHAQEGTAEQLVAGMDKADMSYRQLMEIMGVASGMMHEGILRQNKQMVQEGAETILTHPAPNHVPWEIMPEEHQKGFKASLVKFDRLLDRYTEATAEAAAKGDWPGASQSLQDLNTSCVTCHAAWKDRAR
ncbi:hypothetical protein SAMN05421721_10556 [Ectothiorhodospira mobilis]|uniref:Cytochrome C n=2 Tax=Ectothiorhodospira mobilis TaxID=195064 RepID=A0A1I4QQY9_ECTMO|nr:hypothetical protein SAMN05421721_10556 [Ectothiorhodospira mobilis]